MSKLEVVSHQQIDNRYIGTKGHKLKLL